MDVEVGGIRIRCRTADLTAQRVDALVNAANVALQHGGGVAGAIARAGGPVVQDESDAWHRLHGPLADGIAAVTSAGDMPARLVVHVAGPVHDPGRDDNATRLHLAVRTALDAAAEQGAASVALPAISAGIYGYPLPEATAEIAAAVVAWCRDRAGTLAEIRLVGIDDDATAAFVTGVTTALAD